VFITSGLIINYPDPDVLRGVVAHEIGHILGHHVARRDEVEKMRIISKFDRMTPEEKAAELINKRLGLGTWAIGGTDAVYKYNSAQYERERIERGEMVGLVEGAVADTGAEEGYSNEQVGEDDY
jgi:predicted Zn-dependent protease